MFVIMIGEISARTKVDDSKSIWNNNQYYTFEHLKRRQGAVFVHSVSAHLNIVQNMSLYD